MEKRVIDKVRAYYDITRNITDKEIAKYCQGSLGEFVAKRDLFIEELMHASVDLVRKCKNIFMKEKHCIVSEPSPKPITLVLKGVDATGLDVEETVIIPRDGSKVYSKYKFFDKETGGGTDVKS